MRFKPMGALRAQKAYSDVLGKKGSLFFSWTCVNRQHLPRTDQRRATRGARAEVQGGARGV
jgi:hypothetical protein